MKKNIPSSFPFFFLFLTLLIVSACQKTNAKKLPILGEKEKVDGKVIGYHEISDFQFVDQDSQIVNNATFKDKIYVVEFFFTSCKTICPKVAQQMLRIHDRFKDHDEVVLLAHTIDPKRDTVGRLKWYAEKLGIQNADKWHFVTGDKEKLYDMADEYFIVAKEDADADGGFDHSPTIILVDKNRRVRSFCNGTDPQAVDLFMEDIETLLHEK
ncbi:MAG TPA: SCO family protein [Phaeodactylibacter sp.]|nr:SCO family protein [Phaeodactylibacter sp.]